MDPTQDTNDATNEVDSHDPIEALHAEIEQLKAQSLVERADLDRKSVV